MRFLEALIAIEASDDPQRPVLRLIGPPQVTAFGERIEIPESCKRLLAFIATRGSGVDRRLAASCLWPNGNNQRAGGNLRTALWRLNGIPLPLVVTPNQALYLSPKVVVDFHVVSTWATRLTTSRAEPRDLDVDAPDIEAMELFPGWYDDWAVLERERFRYRMLHAAETLSRLLGQRGLTGVALATAISVVSADPLRESAQQVLIEAHLRAGNLVEARRCYDAYRELLRQELDVEPGAELTSLVSQSYSFDVPRPRPGNSIAVQDGRRT
jgi:DNA-binding SARP family transcriptional activator